MERQDYIRFIETWMYRATRQEEMVDEADKFISLWIAFNAWLKMTYGEDVQDKTLIDKVSKNKELQIIFEELLKSNHQEFLENISELETFSIIDMRYPNDADKAIKMENRDFENFIKVVYRIRCNLFHGRKDATDKEGIDYRLICLAYNSLLPLFYQYFIKYFQRNR